MTTKGNRTVSGIFNGIFAATLLTEIVCGLIWAFYNFTDYKNFAESQNLYAHLSSNAWMLPVIYILQIIVTGAFFYFASAAFLRAVTGDRVPARYPFLLMLLILFNPYVWMTEFTLLPDAPGLSMAFLVIAYAFLFFRMSGNEKDWIYALMSGVWVVVLGLFFKKYFMAVLPVICLLGILSLFHLLGNTKKENGKEIEKETEKENGKGAGPGISAIISMAMIFLPVILFAIAFIRIVSSIPSENELNIPTWMEYIFRIRLSGMTESSFGSVPAFFKGFCKEWLAAVLSPWILAFPKYPWGDTVNPFYVSILWQKAASLTSFYLKCSSIGFALLVSAAVLNGIFKFFTGKEKKQILTGICVFLGILIFPAFLFLLLCIPEFDFRNAMIAYITWAVFGTALTLNNNSLEGEK